MLYSVSRIDARNVGHIVATNLSLETANLMRDYLMIRHPEEDFVVEPVNPPAPNPDAPPESN